MLAAAGETPVKTLCIERRAKTVDDAPKGGGGGGGDWERDILGEIERDREFGRLS